jgi:hypothetical protein
VIAISIALKMDDLGFAASFSGALLGSCIIYVFRNTLPSILNLQPSTMNQPSIFNHQPSTQTPEPYTLKP